MTKTEIENSVIAQRRYFAEGNTLNLSNRKAYLSALYNAVKRYEGQICDALYKDLGKSARESYMCEIGLTLSEVSYLLKHFKSLTSKKRVKTPLAQFPSKSAIYPSPYGTVLIMSPWNYPFLLSIEPLAEAVAAGNTVILKPSNYSPNTSAVMIKLLTEVFPPELVSFVEGGREENAALLDIKFDYIFFTGSKTVGKLVYKKAAEFLTPVTLELGGKSPCIVDKTADIKASAKRIVFGKYLNAGQTCVAPDYILVHEDVKKDFLNEVKKQIILQFGSSPMQNNAYGKIITKKHFDRVNGLIAEDKVFYGGKSDGDLQKIEPTVLDNINYQDLCMQEEIFGPIMPIISYNDIDKVIKSINEQPSPLALDIFTEDKVLADKVIKTCRFGGGAVNDVVVHLATFYMPFGGFGESGMGSYHGKKGFDTFTHYKSVIKGNSKFEIDLRYQPYKDSHDKIVKKFLK